LLAAQSTFDTACHEGEWPDSLSLRSAFTHVQRLSRLRYRKAFEDFARALQREFPGVKFNGDVHHPGDLRVAAAQVLQLAFFGGLAISVIGKGVLPPRVAEFMAENQMLTFGALFGCNVLAGKLINTGAFEISYNGTPVWSKIEKGRFPTMPELVDLLREAAIEQ